MTIGRPGIVDLRDVAHRYLCDARAIARFVAAVGLAVDPEPAWRGFAPPRVVVAIAQTPDQLVRSRPWLAAADHLIVVRDLANDTELVADPRERRELQELEWTAPLATFPGVELVDWSDPADPAPCRDAIARALAHTPIAAAPGESRPNPDLELPASAWLAWTAEHSFALEAGVASRLIVRDGRPVLVDASGAEIDLAAPRAPIAIARVLDPGALIGLPSTADPRRLTAYGFDPIHPIGWRGHRMAIYWSYVGAAEIGHLAATDHDYPCGPAKKLWGYADNDPVAVAVSPRADACVQTFEHDAMVTGNVPIAWHRAGEVDVAAFAADRRRAVLYAHTAEFLERVTDDLTDEDNRELAPVVVLGPDAAVRYAVDLRHRVVRLTGREPTVGEVLGGPDSGYAVFDADHRLVRRGTGRLLGGWFRHATVEDAGWLWREDLATGHRTRLDSADRVACVDPEVELVVQDAVREGRHVEAAALRAGHATRKITGELGVVAIPGTRNVLELAAGDLRVL